MILGIGSDMIDIRRIENMIARYSHRFIHRIYTDKERTTAMRRANAIPTYAKRFAAKEACAKALGTGIRRGVFFCDMGVVNLSSGQPTMELTGGALRRLQSMIPANHTPRIHVTITDDDPWAQAFVIIEALPNPT